MSDREVVRREPRGQALWLVIDREERRNAINNAVLDGLRAGIEAAEADPEVRAVVLTGAGDRAFCAGGDLQPAADGSPFEADPSQPELPVIRLFRAVEDCTKPVVARVNGHALAGGMGLLCACDLAVASDRATFGTPEVKVGLFPMTILGYMLRVLPRRKLLEMCITGEPWSATEALEHGLVNYVAPADELDAKLDWLLARIVDKSPTAVRIGKTAFRAMEDMTLAQAFAYSQSMLPPMARTEDAREGFAAFREKRAPQWTGR